MKTRILFITSIIILVFIGLILILQNQSPKKEEINTIPTKYISEQIIPTKFIPIQQIPFVSTEPPLNAKDVNLSQIVKIQIDSKINIHELSLVVVPMTLFSRTDKNQTIILKPNTIWRPSSKYAIMFNQKSNNTFSNIYYFSTIGGTPTPYTIPPQNTVKINQEFALKNAPDVFLHNLVPFENTYFKITVHDNESKNPTYDFFFTITKKQGSGEEVKKAVHDWLISQGMNETQISKLDIRYSP
ncbi:MAG: hypothetical protein WCO06_05445 [Candidatus Roizmanbacteria bacterium]